MESGREYFDKTGNKGRSGTETLCAGHPQDGTPVGGAGRQNSLGRQKLMSPWQQEMKLEGMALLYPDRSTVQFVLAEEAERRPCIRALLYLRDERSAPGQGWLEQAEQLIEELPAGRFFEYWLALLRHQKSPWFEKLSSRLPSNGLADSLRFLRAATLTRTLQGPEQIFGEGLQAAAVVSPVSWSWTLG